MGMPNGRETNTTGTYIYQHVDDRTHRFFFVKIEKVADNHNAGTTSSSKLFDDNQGTFETKGKGVSRQKRIS